MKLTGGLIGAALLAALVGCTAKPSQQACEKAVQNIRRLTGDTHTEAGPEQRAAIRSCQAQSSRDIAECYMNAQTKEQLFTCGGELAEAVRESEKKANQDPSPVPGTAGSGAGETPHPPPAGGSSAGPGASSSAPPPPASETPAGAAAEPSGSGATGAGTNP